MPATLIEQLKAKPVSRISTGIDEMDWIFGGEGTSWGMATGAMTLIGGEAGAGKTRAVCAICKAMMEVNPLANLLYFQLEMPMSQWKDKYGSQVPHDGRFFVSEEKDLLTMVKDIVRVRPTLVIVDSVNKIREFRNGYGSDVIEEAFRKVIEPLSGHVIFVTHLNAENDIKGGTALPHMVDTIMLLTKNKEDSSIFYVEVAYKHRFGITDRHVYYEDIRFPGASVWEHREHGAVCTSAGRLTKGLGDDWLDSHDVKGYAIGEEDEVKEKRSLWKWLW